MTAKMITTMRKMTLRTQAMNAVTFKANNEVHLFGLSDDDSSLLVKAIPEVVGTLPGKKGSGKWEKKYYHSDFGNSANINPVFPMPYPILLLWWNECVVISRKKLLVSVAFLYILFCWDQIVSLGELFIAINQREKTVLRLGYQPKKFHSHWGRGGNGCSVHSGTVANCHFLSELYSQTYFHRKTSTILML